MVMVTKRVVRPRLHQRQRRQVNGSSTIASTASRNRRPYHPQPAADRGRPDAHRPADQHGPAANDGQHRPDRAPAFPVGVLLLIEGHQALAEPADQQEEPRANSAARPTVSRSPNRSLSRQRVKSGMSRKLAACVSRLAMP